MNHTDQHPTPFPYRPLLFHLSAVQFTSLLSGARTDKMLLSTYCLLTTMKGQGTISIDGVRRPLLPGQCFVLDPGMIIELESAESNVLDAYRVYFEADAPGDSSCTRETVEELLCTGEVRFQPFWRMAEFVEQLYRNRHHNGALESFKSNVRFQEIVASLLEQNRPGVSREDAAQAVNRTIAYMHRSYHEEISIEQMAQDAGISRWQYNALFKSLTGTTPIDYLTELRINRAKALLVMPGQQLKDIAARAGFRDEYYFSRRFKQTVGMSPKHYAHSNMSEPRILTLQYLAEVLSLGIKPVGTYQALLDRFQAEADGVQGIEEPFETETMLKLKPDLIILPSFIPRQQFKQFAKVAPAVQFDWFDDIYDRLTKIGELLGRQKEAKRWIESYEAKAERTRELLASHVRAGETATAFIYDTSHRKLFVYGAHNFGYTLYRALHFAPPEKVKSLIGKHRTFRWTAIEPEAIGDYAGDRVFLALPSDELALEWARNMLNSKLWRSLPAVRNGRAYIVEHKWGLYDPITLESHLDEMVRLLAT
ncbi:MAG: hypothetical protein K0Q94_3617 [Paenibacillus sp.]|jgi:iron complex transport system substrate-binding protein|nr:hypothetical protein [Paenibacillus sp.]